MKFRCLAEPRIIEVEAATHDEAQNLAFARYVRDLTPNQISAWVSTPEDVWAVEEEER